LPSELLDLAEEIAVWAILGVILFTQFSDLGLRTFHVSSQASIATIAEYVSTMINIVGSRGVEVHMDLPSTSLIGDYLVFISGRTVLVQSNRDTFSCQAFYLCASTALEPSHHYLLLSSAGMVVFKED